MPAGTIENLNDKLLTPVPFPTWGTGPHCEGHTPAGCAESHSAVPLPGRPFALTIDEVYGTFTASSFGWPWGWARLWNVAQPRRPHIIGEYKLLQNTTAYTPAPGENEFTSYSSHNPTALRDLIFDSWHSGGRAGDRRLRPGHPGAGGLVSPTPLASVANEERAPVALRQRRAGIRCGCRPFFSPQPQEELGAASGAGTPAENGLLRPDDDVGAEVNASARTDPRDWPLT